MKRKIDYDDYLLLVSILSKRLMVLRNREISLRDLLVKAPQIKNTNLRLVECLRELNSIEYFLNKYN